jgi:kynureninase
VSRSAEDLARSPNPLAPGYARFRVGGRLLLTGHSHQAWPDVALDGQVEAFEDAALAVDAKWQRAFARAERLRAGLRVWFGEPRAGIALAPNTHDLVLRFLSALDLVRRPRLLTTDGEFHTLRRQLARLAEAGIEVERLPARPAETLAERLAARVGDRTAAVLVSAVLFETSARVPGLGALAAACDRKGAHLLVDAYHALGCLRFELAAERLEGAWVVGGGYKYLELGEGNAFLRLPPGAQRLRPAITGWFAEFAELASESDPERVGYPEGAARYAGSTYDPTSHYRAARVLDFFVREELTPDLLERNYRRQVARLAAAFDALDLAPELVRRDRALAGASCGGFLALETPHAERLVAALAARGVATDHRGPWLRLGPAPYLSDAQLDEAIVRLGEAARTLAPG